VLVWAFAGIAVKQTAEPVVVASASAAAVLVTILILIALIRPPFLYAPNMDKN
jgi:benzodiazapine receptor